MIRLSKAIAATLLVCGVVAAQPCQAESAWLPARDVRLRNDITLLVDEGVLRLPTTGWPIAAADVAFALRRIEIAEYDSAALRAALIRVQSIVIRHTGDDGLGLDELRIRAGGQSLLRNPDSPLRADAEASIAGGFRGGRLSANVVLTGAASAPDGRDLTLDGSDLTFRWGNWNFSANTLERAWGPGHESGLILSTNARPMPQLAVDRAVSTPPSVPILGWVGPWRFSAFLARMESHRPDVDAPLFMGMRLSFKPLQVLELGLSRTAQFCGEGRPCGFSTFGRVLLGRDNAGIRVSPEDEPGNQMAGFDARLVSPIESLPLAVYAEMIGEDNSSTGIPEKYLGLFGAEAWWLLEDGGAIRAFAEYSDTTCSFQRPDPYVDCAYRQGIFDAGYRYHGLSIGHTSDADSAMVAVGVRWILPSGEEWRIGARHARLDRYGEPNVFDGVTFGPSRYRSAEVGWRGSLFGEGFSAQLGVEHGSAVNGNGRTKVYGALQWQRPLFTD